MQWIFYSLATILVKICLAITKAFAEKMKLDSSFLLHLGMDGPYVNLSFEQKLIDNLNARQVSTS